MVALERPTNRGLIPELPNNETFLDAIGRSELKEHLTLNSSIVSVSMGNDALGGAYAGGLEILEGDKFHQAAETNIPYKAVTLFYPQRWRQKISRDPQGNFRSYEDPYSVHPQDFGFRKELMSFSIRANGDEPRFEVYTQGIGSAEVVTVYEPGLGGLYSTSPDSDHRLYQNVVLGFGGYEAIRMLDIDPPVVLINEGASALYSLAELNHLCQEGKTLEQAQQIVGGKTTLVNHTLEQAAEPEYSKDQLERFVLKNITSESVRNWLLSMINSQGGKLKLSMVGLALSEKRIGVSLLHAQKASEQFRDSDGRNVAFDAITNGIHSRWTHPDFLRLDREAGIIDEFGLPKPDSLERIFGLDPDEQREIKNKARRELREYLPKRVDQYGQPIHIPEDAKTVGWARRPVPYKRPEMPYDDPLRLAEILERENTHFLFSGKVRGMGKELPDILKIIDKNQTLKARAHYIQDYDKELARHLVAGSDIWLNTPIVGKEACGTSIFKAIKNRTILISTEDGGVADVSPPPCLIISGRNRQEESDSLYTQLERSSRIVDGKDPVSWDNSVKTQLAGYNSIASGGRMLGGYINYTLSP